LPRRRRVGGQSLWHRDGRAVTQKPAPDLKVPAAAG
jgi:hypothetical protein